jgi:hypothetical protein
MNLINCKDRRWEYSALPYGGCILLCRDSSTLSDCALLGTSHVHWSEQESPMVGGNDCARCLPTSSNRLSIINAVTWLSYQHSYKQIGYTIEGGDEKRTLEGKWTARGNMEGLDPWDIFPWFWYSVSLCDTTSNHIVRFHVTRSHSKTSLSLPESRVIR